MPRLCRVQADEKLRRKIAAKSNESVRASVRRKAPARPAWANVRPASRKVLIATRSRAGMPFAQLARHHSCL